MAKKKNKDIDSHGVNSRLVESRGEKIFNILMNILGIIVSLLVLYPIYYTLIASISKPFYVDTGDVMFWPIGFTLESYTKAFEKPLIGSSYLNSIYYTVFGVIVNMAFTTTMAYALSKTRLIWRKFWVLFTVFTMWFNAGLIPTYMNFRDLGLLDTRTAIILGFAVNTYNLIIMKSFFEQLPVELEEAAFMDGANNLRIFWQIFLPLSKPALATVAMFYTVSRWNSYFWAMNILRDDSKIPLQVLLKKLVVDQVATENESAVVTAASLSSPTTVIYATIIIAIVPMLIVYPFAQKYFKAGVTLGAVKG